MVGVSLTDFVRFSLTFIRLLTFLVVAPLFSMRNVPIMAKVGLAALCSFLVLPPLEIAGNPESISLLIVLSLQEVAIGLLLGFVVILVFSILTFAGHYVDAPTGFRMASVFDPSIGGQVPVFSQLYNILGFLIFLGIDGHLWLFQGLHQSFRAIPLGAAINLEPSFALLMDLIPQIFLIGSKIALPVTAAILLTDVGLGIVIRAVPQINVFVIGFPIKIVVGLLVVIFILPAFVVIASQLLAWDGLLFRYFHGLLALGGN